MYLPVCTKTHKKKRGLFGKFQLGCKLRIDSYSALKVPLKCQDIKFLN